MTTPIVDLVAPSARQYNQLRGSVGWDPFPEALAARLLAASKYHAAFHENGSLLAYGRAIGDEAYLYLQDVMVVRERQHLGLGRAIIQSLLTQIPRPLIPGGIVALLAVPGTEAFYGSLGFRVVAPENTAMKFIAQDRQGDT